MVTGCAKADSLNIGENVIEKPPFRKAGFLPMFLNNGGKDGFKTTAHAQCNLKLIEHVQ
jgi:hypothetical protein